MHKVNSNEAFETFSEYWIAGELNDSYVKIAKFTGKFDWHHHNHEDELFLVVKGRLRMELRTGDIDLDPGEFIMVPKGTEHCPEAPTDECNVLLLEPKVVIVTKFGFDIGLATGACNGGNSCQSISRRSRLPEAGAEDDGPLIEILEKRCLRQSTRREALMTSLLS
jgi:mannose-6-phosphate isomerase-like protein (cupin superfamily)